MAPEQQRVARTPLFHARSYAIATGLRFASREAAAGHYLSEGAARGIPPHPVFHLPWYGSEHPGLADGNPLLHLLAHDPGERSPHPQFDPRWYLDHNPDVARMAIDPLLHYLRFGVTEGRDPGPFFSTLDYLATHPDIDPVEVNPLAHLLARRGGRAFQPSGRVVVERPSAADGGRFDGTVLARIVNTGRARWTPQSAAPAVVAWRWLLGDERVPGAGGRALVPVELDPGAGFRIPLAVPPPAAPGRHRLQLCVIPADTAWPSPREVAGVALVGIEIGPGAAAGRGRPPEPPPDAMVDERPARRPTVGPTLAERMRDADPAIRPTGSPRPFSHGRRPVIRWIKGDGLDDPVLCAAIARATRLFGDRVDYCLCTQGISGARARALLAHATQPVELWPVDAADNPWLARRLATAGCYPDRFGYWWKWFPERVRPDAPEWILDGDMLVTAAPAWFARWHAGTDVLRVTQDDRPRTDGVYGPYHSLVDPAFNLYSGLVSLPPGRSYRRDFEEALAAPGLRMGHDGRSNLEEQGVAAVAFQRAGATPIPLNEFPFARATEPTLDYGVAGDQGRAWGIHFSHSFRRRNRHFERMVAARMVPDCAREPAVTERFRWLANRGQWGGPGWSLPDETAARIVAAAGPYAGRDTLEIGTSRGYLAAMLAAVGCRVTSIDRADRGAAVNLADMGVELVRGDGAALLAAGDRRFDLVVVDLHGNGPAVWERLWPLATGAVRPGGRLIVNNTHLWRMPAWRDESGLRPMLDSPMAGWDVAVFPEPFPGLGIWTRPA